MVRRFDIANPTGVTISVPGIDQHDMERRRYFSNRAFVKAIMKFLVYSNCLTD